MTVAGDHYIHPLGSCIYQSVPSKIRLGQRCLPDSKTADSLDRNCQIRRKKFSKVSIPGNDAATLGGGFHLKKQFFFFLLLFFLCIDWIKDDWVAFFSKEIVLKWIPASKMRCQVISSTVILSSGPRLADKMPVNKMSRRIDCLMKWLVNQK